jgi:hypothetical protein
MCNAYEIGRRVGKNPLKNSLLPAASIDLPAEPRLIRRTDPAPVITVDGELATMRWGFERPTLGTINNSRPHRAQSPSNIAEAALRPSRRIMKSPQLQRSWAPWERRFFMSSGVPEGQPQALPWSRQAAATRS